MSENSKLLQNKQDFDDWVTVSYHSCYAPNDVPIAYPCIVVFHTAWDGSTDRDYTWFEYVYNSDFNTNLECNTQTTNEKLSKLERIEYQIGQVKDSIQDYFESIGCEVKQPFELVEEVQQLITRLRNLDRRIMEVKDFEKDRQQAIQDALSEAWTRYKNSLEKEAAIKSIAGMTLEDICKYLEM